MISREQQEIVRDHAEGIRRLAANQSGRECHFDEDGVRWLDAYLNRMHDIADDKLKAALLKKLGCYYGVCIIQTLGGEWEYDPEYGLGITFSDGNVAFPFNKVDKQLQNGPEESVHGMFVSIRSLFER